jgi:hypothetical protein
MGDFSTSIQNLSGGGNQPSPGVENTKLVQDILNDLNGSSGNQQQPLLQQRPAEPEYDTQYRQSQDRLTNQQFDVLHNYNNEYDNYIQQHNNTTQPDNNIAIYNKVLKESKDPGIIFVLVCLVNYNMVHRFVRSNVLKIIGNDKYTVYGILVTKALLVSVGYYVIQKFVNNQQTKQND